MKIDLHYDGIQLSPGDLQIMNEVLEKQFLKPVKDRVKKSKIWDKFILKKQLIAYKNSLINK